MKKSLASLTAAALVAGAALTGCSKLTHRTTPCGVVLDGSGSATNFDAKKRTTELLPGFLEENKCGTLTYVPLGTDSGGSNCVTVKNLPLDPDLGAGSDQKVIRAGRYQKAVRDSMEVLDCLQATSPSSDVLGALARAAEQRPDGDGTYHILVISDLLHVDKTVDFYTEKISTPQERAALLNRLNDEGRIPRLTDVSLEISDRGRTLSDPQRQVWIRLLWAQLFGNESVGKPEVKYD